MGRFDFSNIHKQIDNSSSQVNKPSNESVEVSSCGGHNEFHPPDPSDPTPIAQKHKLRMSAKAFTNPTTIADQETDQPSRFEKSPILKEPQQSHPVGHPVGHAKTSALEQDWIEPTVAAWLAGVPTRNVWALNVKRFQDGNGQDIGLDKIDFLSRYMDDSEVIQRAAIYFGRTVQQLVESITDHPALFKESKNEEWKHIAHQVKRMKQNLDVPNNEALYSFCGVTLSRDELFSIILYKVSSGVSIGNCLTSMSLATEGGDNFPSYPEVQKWMELNRDYSLRMLEAERARGEVLIDKAMVLVEEAADSGFLSKEKLSALKFAHEGLVKHASFVNAKFKDSIKIDSTIKVESPPMSMMIDEIKMLLKDKVILELLSKDGVEIRVKEPEYIVTPEQQPELTYSEEDIYIDDDEPQPPPSTPPRTTPPTPSTPTPQPPDGDSQ